MAIPLPLRLAALGALLAVAAPASAQISKPTESELDAVPPQFNDLVHGRSDKINSAAADAARAKGKGPPPPPGMTSFAPGTNPSRDRRDFRGMWVLAMPGGGGPPGPGSASATDARPGVVHHPKIDGNRLCMVALGVNPATSKVYQTADRLTFVGGNELRARRIRVGATADPRAPATYNGQSVAHWEGDVLVVDTTRIKPGLITALGFDVEVGVRALLLSTPTLHVGERISRSADGQTLTIEQRWDDPAIKAAPSLRTLRFSFAKDGPVFDNECEISGDLFGPAYDKPVADAAVKR